MKQTHSLTTVHFNFQHSGTCKLLQNTHTVIYDMAFAKYVIMSHLRCFSVTIALPHTILNPTGEQCATVKNLTRDLLKADINSSGNQSEDVFKSFYSLSC